MVEPEEQTTDDALRRRADRILAAALDLDGAEREALLDRECGSEGPLRSLVLELVALCQEPDDDLEQRARASLASVQSDLEREALGTAQVGPYRLMRELGRGGMGVVYLAARDDGLFEHSVAVKVLHLGSVERLGRRFAQERQILAALDHPAIARLLDAGSTPSGLPYLVMERVEGLPIDRFCARGRLPIDQRLELFRQVCEAVEAAHRSLVVHRDLKPSNILVAADGRPKLLDFGIAKLLEEDPSAGHTTVHMLTLEWASPEQLRGRPTTVQSDVYQLGLLLHLLLTGRLPYSLSGLSPAEQEAVVCEQEARAPSSRVRALPEPDQSALAGEVGLSSGRVAPALTGDLDAIVLKALRKQPRHRYDSVERLRRDVERHLGRLPVSARLPTFGYRAGRFLERHRLAALATTLVLTAFLVLGSLSMLRITAERDNARREARRAEQREQEARAATDFLAELLRKASPHRRGQAQELTVRQALDLGLEELETGLRDTPRVRARVLHELTKVFNTLGEPRRGIELGNEAIALWESAGPDLLADLAATLHAVGIAYETNADYDLARRYYQRALEIRRDLYAASHPDVASLLSDLAILTDKAGDHEAAGRLFEEALAILDSTEEEAYPGQKAMLLGNLGIFHKNLGAELGVPGAFEKAEIAMRRCLEEVKARSELASRIPAVYVNLGNLQFEMGRLEESEASLRAGLEEMTAWFGADHPNIGLVLSNLGRTHTALGRFDEAERELGRALAIRERSYGPDHPGVAVVVHRLGLLRVAQQRPVDAIGLFRRALDVRRAVHGPDHPDVGASLRALARCHAGLGEIDRAAPLYRQAVEIYDRADRDGEAAELRRELAALAPQGLGPSARGPGPAPPS